MVNAFWLDRDLDLAARWLVDRHVTSSVLECSMVLTTAVRERGYPDPDDGLYVTHRDHPLTRWAAESHANWLLLRSYTRHAHDEWRYRWDHGPGEVHKSWAVARALDPEMVGSLPWPETAGRDPPQVTGRWHARDYVDAYRLYYANEKRHLFSWAKDRGPPPWLDEYALPDGVTDHPY